MFLLTRGGGALSLSHASESPSEISAEQNQEGFFSKTAGIISSFFSWSISTFGNTAGKIFGWLGIGTPALFLLWIVKKIIGHFFHKHVIIPAKKAVNKHTMNKYGKNVFANEDVEIKAPRRALTRKDIVRITGKYGATEKNNEDHDFEEVYTLWQYGIMTWFFVYFCENSIHAQRGLFSSKTDYMDYSELRKDDTTMSSLRRRFDDYPGEFYNMLWELHEA